jgi:hypothetical protein
MHYWRFARNPPLAESSSEPNGCITGIGSGAPVRSALRP